MLLEDLKGVTLTRKEKTMESSSTSRDTVVYRRDTVRMVGIGHGSRYPAKSP